MLNKIFFGSYCIVETLLIYEIMEIEETTFKEISWNFQNFFNCQYEWEIFPIFLMLEACYAWLDSLVNWEQLCFSTTDEYLVDMTNYIECLLFVSSLLDKCTCPLWSWESASTDQGKFRNFVFILCNEFQLMFFLCRFQSFRLTLRKVFYFLRLTFFLLINIGYWYILQYQTSKSDL